jgi:hypothetical protein
MTEQSGKSRSLIPLYILIILFYVIVALQGSEEYVLLEAISHESDFEVNLSEGINYKLWIDSPDGPDKVNLTISKGSYTAFESTFVLTQPGKSYTPYNPEFTVKENGTYHVHAKPFSSGTVYLEIEKITSSDSNN